MSSLYDTPVIEHAETLQVPSLLLPSPPLTTRGITAETCARYSTFSTGTPLEIATAVIRDGETIGYQLRRDGWTLGRTRYNWWAAGSQRYLIGTQLWDGNPCDVYVCEGITDCMAVSQHIDSGLAVCYGGNPSDAQLTSWLADIRRMVGHCNVYLCFDADDKGREYTDKFVALWGVTNIYGLVLPANIKDAAQRLMDGGDLQFATLPQVPDTVLTAQQVIDTATTSQKSNAMTTGIFGLDNLIGGYKPGKLIVLAGTTKQGKSEFCVDLVVKYIREHGKPVLFIPLELTMYETLLRFPDDCHSMLYFVKHYGATDSAFIETNVRSCVQLGVSMVVIDHITAASTSFTEGLQTTAIDALMYQLKALVNDLSLTMIAVSHTNSSCTGVVEVQHLRGSAAICQVASVTLGLQRLEDGVTELRSVTPDRDTGKVGRVNFTFAPGSGFTEYESKFF
jgi:5S rRNA maturation endonuclease (ribonuclease M5)